ncbi:hypothetical protein [Actinomadura violacea]|uniref:Uncharacterized protein n=1 Tax=Actinomadura violacea TaxID=2819934 RepID=A0ABS3S0A4_9ACTN|nr:hypothetical protein [Actinomadura violacea]MBO2461724.1 hypothetical protein [Actinomadura violacea]
MSDSNSTGHDPRYARARDTFVVLYSEGGIDSVEGVCVTEDLAHTLVAGQWSPALYSVHQAKLIEELPERRPLWYFSGTVSYPGGDVTTEYDDFMAQGEFPGIGNGALVPLEETKTELTNTDSGGWHFNAVGWDRAEVEAEVAGLVDAAKRQRAALVEAFKPYGHRAVVTVHGSGKHAGKMLTRFSRGGRCWWSDAQHVSRQHIHDHELDPGDFAAITFGEPSAITEATPGGAEAADTEAGR